MENITNDEKKKIIPFSIYEAVLLLDAYLESKNAEIPRLRVVKRLSNDLRTIAINEGKTIDDSFRSVDGLSYQITSMKDAFEKSKPSTCLFETTVELYQNDPQEYNRLLMEARAMVNKKPTVKKQFLEWLSLKVSPNRMSEYWLCYHDIEKFCMKKRMLSTELLETTDIHVLRKIENTLSSSKLFRVENKRPIKTVLTAMHCYVVFIRENDELLSKSTDSTLPQDSSRIAINDSKETAVAKKDRSESISKNVTDYVRTDADRELINKYPILFKKVYFALHRINDETKRSASPETIQKEIGKLFRTSDVKYILERASWSKEICYGLYAFSTSIIEQANESAQSSSLVMCEKSIDFDDIPDLSFTHPLKVLYFGKDLGKFSSWADAYVKLVSEMYNDYQSLIPIGKSFLGNQRVDLCFARDSSLMMSPRRTMQGLFLETNLTVSDMVKSVKALMDICRIKRSDLVIVYRSKSQISTAEKIQSKTTTRENENTDIIKVLKEHYKYGLKYESIREILRFRQFAQAMGIVAPESDEQLIAAIKSSGVIIDGKVYYKNESIQDDITQKVNEIISSGATVIYYDSLLQMNDDWMDSYAITSEEVLKEYLQKYIENCTFSKKFFIVGNKLTEKEAVTKELLRVWGDNKTAKVVDLSERLPYIPIDNIWRVISGNSQFVLASEGEYLRIDRLQISASERADIIQFVDDACQENGFASLSDIPLGDIEEENYELTLLTIYSAIYKLLFPDGYSLNGRIITKSGVSLDTVALLKNYIKDKSECDFDEIADRVVELNGAPNRQYAFQALYDEMVRVSNNRYIAENDIEFDVDGTDKVLSNIIKDRFIAIREITTFALFPYCGQSWNHFLLESYCYKYSRKYKLCILHFNDKNAGMIVDKSFDASYNEMLIIELTRANVELNAEAAGEFLFENGYLAKRKYAALDDIIQKVKEIRKER